MITTIAICSALTLSAPEPAKTQQPVEVQQTFTAEEMKAAAEALRTMAQQFHNPQPQVQPPAPPPPPMDKKTMADVADKALDISTKYIAQVAGLLEKAAPRVWEVMIRQQYAKAAGELLTPFMFVLVFFLISQVVRFFWKDPGDRHDDERSARLIITFIAPIVLCSISAGVFAYRISDVIQYIINPEYYAIKDLVAILFRGGF